MIPAEGSARRLGDLYGDRVDLVAYRAFFIGMPLPVSFLRFTCQAMRSGKEAPAEAQ